MNGLIPVLPLFAVDLGMSKSMTGLYLSSIYISLLAGNYLTGLILDKIKNIKLLLVSTTALFTLLLFLHNIIKNHYQLIFLSILLWFVIGSQMIILNTLQGRQTKKSESGKNYAKLSITTVLGVVTGNFIIGLLLNYFSMRTMFLFIGAMSVFMIYNAFLLKEIKVKDVDFEKITDLEKQLVKSKKISLFFVAAIVISIVNYILLLSLSLLLKDKGYQNSTTGLVIASGAILAIPMIYFTGKYSDIKGKKPFLILGYGAYIAGFIFLSFPVNIIFFVLAAFIRAFAVFSKNSLGFAYMKDIATKEKLGKAISQYGSTIWLGGIIGFLSAGFLIENLGYYLTFLTASILTGIAILLLIIVFSERKYKD